MKYPITRISKLQNHGVFRDFSWSNNLPDFGEYNLIYGWNGTGKTTLSRLLRDLELKRSPQMGGATLKINGSDIQGEKFPQQNVQIRVFNQDFIRENVFTLQSRDMPPILIIGAEDIEKQKRVDHLKKQLVNNEHDLESIKEQENTIQDQFETFCSDRAREIKEMLRRGGQGKYNNYNKSNFKDDAIRMIDNDNRNYQLGDDQHEKFLSQYREILKPEVNEIIYNFPDFNSIKNRLSELLEKTVVSEAIEALKAHPELADWTRQGLVLHRNPNTELCLFCEQKLPKDRISALEKHFSSEYEQFRQRIDQMLTELEAASEAAEKLRLPVKELLYGNLVAEYESQEIALKEGLQLVQNFAGNVARALEDKKERIFEKISLRLEAPQIKTEIVENLNAVVREHNQTCDQFNTRVEAAGERFAQDKIAINLLQFIKFNTKLTNSKKERIIKNQEINDLKQKILNLEQNIIAHRRPAEELNRDLKQYLGYDELGLKVKETGYEMTRNNLTAENISEGEATAIALLYFLKSLQDRRFSLQNGIIVLDDPISSLDSNALFLAFGFIRERTANATQLFILTHNFSLFRQICNWFKTLKNQKKKKEEQRPARFYMLEYTLNHTGRNSTIKRLDSLLEDYNSEYHYLFSRIYKASELESSRNLEQNYVLPNIARRMLEIFLAFRVPKSSGNLWQQMEEINFDKSKKYRIYRFLNTHSHGDAIDESDHDLSALSEGQSVLKDLMEMIKSEDDKHFLAMEELVNESNKQNNST